MSGWTLTRIDLSFLSQARNSSDKPLLVAEETEDEDTFLSLFCCDLSFFLHFYLTMFCSYVEACAAHTSPVYHQGTNSRI